MIDEKKFIRKITFGRVRWFLYHVVVKDIIGKTKRYFYDAWLKAIIDDRNERDRREIWKDQPARAFPFFAKISNNIMK